MAIHSMEPMAFTAGSTVTVMQPSLPLSQQVSRLQSRSIAHGGVDSSLSKTSMMASGALAGLAAVAVGSRQGRRNTSRISRAAVTFNVGQKVAWRGEAGTVQYFGPVDFAKGNWLGIALDQPKGLHDGTVLGKSYYQCTPRHGIFCQPEDVDGSGAAPATAAPAAAAPAAAASSGAVSVGQKVNWKGQSGTVQYVGKVSFSSGEWVGIQLDQPNGMHDGSVFGVSYFTCPPKTGVFCSPAEIGGAAPPAPAAPVAAAPPAAVPAAAPAGGSFSVGQRVNWNGNAGTVQYVGTVGFSAGEWIGVALDEPKGMHDGSLFGKTYFSCGPKQGIFSQAAGLQAA
mmetsp:Transcript_32834/g.60078  ORF Transcript_32834/g.60078 Transcript_32834/m.60078 type:complete len:340 (-) Transcript_32834:137-1156(-)